MWLVYLAVSEQQTGACNLMYSCGLQKGQRFSYKLLNILTTCVCQSTDRHAGDEVPIMVGGDTCVKLERKI